MCVRGGAGGGEGVVASVGNLKGLSHEIDFKNFDNNLQYLA